MKNTLQTYAWGSRTAIAKMMARPFPTEAPEAEMWLGAHPKAPSKVWVEERWHSLDEWISRQPEETLGSQVCARFEGQLPYLFKILAAGQPLSIQAHPSKAQARSGFENENQLGIPMDAAHRNYKDAQHKPEVICAITPFWALCGFREVDGILDAFDALWPRHRRNELKILQESGLKPFFQHLMAMGDELRRELVREVIRQAAQGTDTEPIQEWMVRLQELYPDDIGVLSPGLLNLIQLQPGEAIALPSCQLHAYLDGLGIELMANSDNVIRGGLTPKHVDVEELLKVLEFNPMAPEVLKVNGDRVGESSYPSHAEEFKLSVIKVAADQAYASPHRKTAPEILLCTQGESRLMGPSNMQPITLTPGQSVFVPAMADQYTIEGDAVLYKAAVNVGA